MSKKPTEPIYDMSAEDELEGVADALAEGDTPSEELVDGLTAEERAEIEAEARKLVEKEGKERAKENYKTKALAEARRIANMPSGEQEVAVHIILPGHADHVAINGVRYYHGGTYKVPQSLAAYLMEKQQRCWQHEDEIGGANRSLVKERNLRIGAKDVGIPNSFVLNRG